MPLFHHISPDQAKAKMENGRLALVDIRDPDSYRQAHITSAVHLTSENFEAFLQATDKACPLIVYCYHGNSSQMAAQFLAEQGFAEVYSLDGGFEEWRGAYPETCSQA